MILILCLLTAACSALPAYPINISSTNPRILVDQNSKPSMMVGDSPWSLIANLAYSNQVFYIQDRAAHGFNTLLISVLDYPYVGGRRGGRLLDGTPPFTKRIWGVYYDLTAPNTNYFAELDRAIRTCATNGIIALLDPIETGQWLTTMWANGSKACNNYGKFLGSRYAGFKNVMWFNGNDFQGWQTASIDDEVMAVAVGIKTQATNQLQTIELNYYVSSSYDDKYWVPICGLNQVYTYYPVYAEEFHAYRQSAANPMFLGEAYYELEAGDAGRGENGTPGVLRRQEYPTALSGAAGQLYGNDYIWQFKSGWQTNLDTIGVTQLEYLENLFLPKEWCNLMPDTNHLVFTKGYGTYESNSGTIGGDTYLSAAYTRDGALAIAYAPTVRTITVNMTKFTNSVEAWWFDPGNGIYSTVPGSPFSKAGTNAFTPAKTNSVGDTDWVLLLEAQPPVRRAENQFVQIAGTNAENSK